MRSVEVTAKTLEEATAQAAQELGVTTEELSVETIEEPRKLLGFLGGQEVRIRASVPGDAAPVPEEADLGTGGISGVEEAPHVAEAQPTEAGGELLAPEAAGSAGTADRALTTVNDILRLMGMDAHAVLVAADPREVSIDIQGHGAGTLIGRHGTTLNALQLITAVIANRGAVGGVRITLDAEGYRERRKQMLERMAHAHAAKVRAARQEIVITDLKPHERRVIHLALEHDPYVETYSEGEGDERYIVISPKAEPDE